MSKLSTSPLIHFSKSIDNTNNIYHFEIDEDINSVHAVLYHSNCHDGIVAAAIMNTANSIKKKELRANLVFVAVQYDEEPPILPSDVSLITVVDFSFDELVMVQAYPGVQIMQLDHHDTAYKRLKGYCDCKSVMVDEHVWLGTIKGVVHDVHSSAKLTTFIDTVHSGAGLAQINIEFIPSDMYEDYDTSKKVIEVCKYFSKYAQDRDLWQYKFGNATRAFRLMLNKNVGKNDIGKMIQLMSLPTLNDDHATKGLSTHDHILNMIQPYMGIVEYEENRINNLAQRVDRFIDEQGRLAALCSYTGKDASDVGGRILELHKDISYVIMYTLNYSCAFLSIRSIDGSALLVAESIGGGGHPNAAGAKVDGSVIYDKYFGLIREYQAKLKESKKQE